MTDLVTITVKEEVTTIEEIIQPSSSSLSTLVSDGNYGTVSTASSAPTIDGDGDVFVHDPNSAAAIVEGITLAVILVSALLGNLLAMVTILRDRSLRRNPHNLLILNLTVMDMGVAVTSMTFTMWSIFDNGYLLLNSDAVCIFNGFGALLFTFGNFTTILCIAIDRYLTVVWSVRFKPTRKRALGFIVFAWTLPIAYTIPPTVDFLSDFVYNPHTHHCSPKWSNCAFYMIWFIFLFGITVPVMAFCYINVIRLLRRQELQLKRHAQQARRSSTLETTSNSDNGIVNIAMTTVNQSNGLGEAEWAPETGSVTMGTAAGSSSSRLQSEDSSSDVISRDTVVLQEKTARKRKRLQIRVSLGKLTGEKQVTLIGLLLVTTTVVCWAPYSTINSCFVPESVVTSSNFHWLGVLSMWIGYTDAALDSLIYCFINRRVRARYRGLIGCRVDCGVLRDRFCALFRQDIVEE
ncbi:octopamine receptor beta-2R-like [Diadema antillarum]|uniref:octopamine receptor beta-2R-like n=1 Tax=Diadema antillarum TaxID=105358 RepID=UPI003A8BDCA7